jgi:hypothetical protein
VIGVDLAVAVGAGQPDGAGFYVAGDELADVLYRRQSLVVVFQGIVGMRVGGDDVLDPAVEDGLGVHLLHGLKEHLFTESPDLVAAVFLLLPRMPTSAPARDRMVAVAWPMACMRSS